MKKILILGMAAFLVFGVASVVSASIVTDPYSVGPTTAQFFAIDNLGTSGDEKVILTNLSFTPGYTLQYSVGSGWIDISPYSTFTVSTIDHRRLVQLQLSPNVGEGTNITNAIMTFAGESTPSSFLYHNVQLLFGDGASFKFASETPAGTDHVSPVPLPSAVWLLGAGLLGLVGVRRKIRS